MHGSPSPIKPGFPKLIDHSKDTESHKSFLKVNSMSVHDQPHSNQHMYSQSPDSSMNNPQQPVMISFNNQFLNDSLHPQHLGSHAGGGGVGSSFVSTSQN
jgi:hypothetical protein